MQALNGFYGLVLGKGDLGIRLAKDHPAADFEGALQGFSFQMKEVKKDCQWWCLRGIDDDASFKAEEIITSFGLQKVGTLRSGRDGPSQRKLFFLASGVPQRRTFDDGSWGAVKYSLSEAPPPQKKNTQSRSSHPLPPGAVWGKAQSKKAFVLQKRQEAVAESVPPASASVSAQPSAAPPQPDVPLASVSLAAPPEHLVGADHMEIDSGAGRGNHGGSVRGRGNQVRGTVGRGASGSGPRGSARGGGRGPDRDAGSGVDAQKSASARRAATGAGTGAANDHSPSFPSYGVPYPPAAASSSSASSSSSSSFSSSSSSSASLSSSMMETPGVSSTSSSSASRLSSSSFSSSSSSPSSSSSSASPSSNPPAQTGGGGELAALIATIDRLSAEVAELRKLLLDKDAENAYLRSTLTTEQVIDLIERFPLEDENRSKKPRRSSPPSRPSSMVVANEGEGEKK